MKLPEICIKRPVFTTVLSLIILVVGIIGFLRIPVRGYPDVDSPVITVTTDYPGASASIIESQITTPIENDLVGLSGLQEVHSYSKQGESTVILEYNLNVNINDAVNDVRNALAKITQELPVDTETPVIEKRDPDSLQTLIVSVTDPKLNTLQLSDYANRYLIPAFEQVMGVASVEMYNERDYAMLINLNPTEMAADGVTVSDLSTVLTDQNVNVPSGQIKSKNRYYSVLSAGQLHSEKQFQHLIIRDDNGALLHFSDVANVKVGPEDTDSAMRVNGKPAVGIGIYADSAANPISVAKAAKNAIKKLSASFPEGMKLHVVWNQTDYLKASLHTVYHDLALAILLVMVVVFGFLKSWRLALIPIVTIPICLIGVCALIYFLGYSINIFTLLALVLAIGLVVDDAIVVLENIYRHVESGMTPFKAAIKGSGEIVFAVIAMTLTLAAVYAPIGFASGMTGIVFRQFAFTLALAVILSGFIALTLSPMMCARTPLPRAKGRSNPADCEKRSDEAIFLAKSISLLKRLLRRFAPRKIDFAAAYRHLLKWVLNHRLIVVAILIGFVGLGVYSFKTLPTELSPAEDMGAFMIKVTPPANASFAYLDRHAKQVESMLRQLPGVKNVMMMTSSDQDGFAFAILKPWNERKYSAKQLMKMVDQKAKQIPGVKVVAFNPSTLGGGGKNGNALQVVLSTNLSFLVLHNNAERFLNTISTSPLIAGTDENLEMNDKQYVVHIKKDLVAAMHVNEADITNTLKTMLGGSKVTSFDYDARDYDVLLQIPQNELQTSQVINQLYVRNSQKEMIPLSSLVTVSPEVAPEELPHQDQLRADTLLIQPAPGVPMGEVMNYLQNTAAKTLPADMHFQFKGAAKRMVESTHTMLGSFLLAIIFIYLVLAAQFESFVDPFIIMLTVPLSIVGALLTLKLTGGVMSIYTNIGFVTLIGLIAKHGILITEFANKERANGKELIPALIDASAQRLRPILMTTAAMVMGALPLAFAHSAGALSRQAIGWVIVGGMTFGTFFSLVVVPVAYSFFSKKNKYKTIN